MMLTISFSLRSTTLEPNVVSQMVNILPTKTIHVEELLGKKNPKRSGGGLWKYTLTGDSTQVLHSMLAAIAPSIGGFAAAAKLFDAEMALGISFEPAGGQGGFDLPASDLCALCRLVDGVNFYFLTSDRIVEIASYSYWLSGAGIKYEPGVESREQDEMRLALRLPVENATGVEIREALDVGFCEASSFEMRPEARRSLVYELVGVAKATKPGEAVKLAIDQLKKLEYLKVMRPGEGTVGLWWAPESGCNGYSLSAIDLANLISDMKFVDFFFSSVAFDDE